MVKYLSDYPIEVIRKACDEWVRTKVFFPAIAEIREVCDRHMPRRVVEHVNELLLEPPRNDWESLSPEQRAKVDAMLAETYRALDMGKAERRRTPPRHVPLTDDERERLLDKLAGE